MALDPESQLGLNFSNSNTHCLNIWLYFYFWQFDQKLVDSRINDLVLEPGGCQVLFWGVLGQ